MKRITLAIMFTAAAFTVAAFEFFSFSNPAVITQESEFVLPVIRTDGFIDAQRFQASAQATSTIVEGRIIAGTVNHHILASDLMARFFKTLKSKRPDIRRFIILSPDHFQAGRGPVSSHARFYRTAEGLVGIDDAVVRELADDGLVTLENSAMFEREHGIGALIPFLSREFPGAKIVPLALNGKMDRTVAQNLGRALTDFINETTLVIISSDMSHYLNEESAMKNDAETLSWLKGLEIDKMRKAQDDHTDNGPAFVALFVLFEKLGFKPNFKLIDHSISSRYVPDRSNTTSYINGVWMK